ncbi:hypothetical protein RHGRI_036580 [Rhododendron griersonianum]|uniref:Glyoxalase/fosfomycin resistance/dioxygenase domain-containing protein n=1 Tax=Rhododendron griersonianum TaxID=479676 RepID=A0AAV6HNM9_9ERIC|nr:hypothetical protein RHGRI_036580 [Rhododendron griersonianum]
MASAIASSLSRLSLLRRLTTITTSPRTPTTFLTIKPKSSNRCRFVSSSMASGSKESPSNNPGLQASADEATKDYFMQQTMYRIKDPKVSLDFYSRVLGMSLLKRLDFPEMKFSLYFMGYEDPTSAPSDSVDRTVWTFSKKATIELTQYILFCSLSLSLSLSLHLKSSSCFTCLMITNTRILLIVIGELRVILILKATIMGIQNLVALV